VRQVRESSQAIKRGEAVKRVGDVNDDMSVTFNYFLTEETSSGETRTIMASVDSCQDRFILDSLYYIACATPDQSSTLATPGSSYYGTSRVT